MNTTKKLICILTAGVALSAASPVFADSFHGRGYDRHVYRGYDRHVYRDYDRHVYRDYDRRHFVVQRPYSVGQPMYYSQPMPMGAMGPGAMIGAAIGTIYDNRQ